MEASYLELQFEVHNEGPDFIVSVVDAHGVHVRYLGPGNYLHFKGGLYEASMVCKHTETGEYLMVYKSLGDNTKWYARPLKMFISEVDRDKYSDITTQFRFTSMTDQRYKKDDDGKLVPIRQTTFGA